jgi:hypothetical protein
MEGFESESVIDEPIALKPIGPVHVYIADGLGSFTEKTREVPSQTGLAKLTDGGGGASGLETDKVGPEIIQPPALRTITE